MVKNPLKSYISDSVFEFLVGNNLLSERGVRDFKIKQEFKALKKEYPTHQALEIIHSRYPYLQYDTIRKIIYRKIKINSPEYFYLF